MAGGAQYDGRVSGNAFSGTRKAAGSSAAVGRENVIASIDCGMGYRVHSQTGWANLKTLAEGAKLASQVLWNR